MCNFSHSILLEALPTCWVLMKGYLCLLWWGRRDKSMHNTSGKHKLWSLQKIIMTLLTYEDTISKFRNKTPMPSSEKNSNKKVLPRERKRHANRGVLSTPSVIRGGVPPSRGTPPARSDIGVSEVGYPPGRGIPQARSDRGGSKQG